MSVFLVSDIVINRVVTALAADSYCRCEILESEIPFDLSTLDGQRQLAESMFRLSVDAVEQRYGDGRAATFRQPDFTWESERVSLMNAFEALCCWLYQCSESAFPKTSKLYQLLERAAG